MQPLPDRTRYRNRVLALTSSVVTSKRTRCLTRSLSQYQSKLSPSALGWIPLGIACASLTLLAVGSGQLLGQESFYPAPSAPSAAPPNYSANIQTYAEGPSIRRSPARAPGFNGQDNGTAPQVPSPGVAANTAKLSNASQPVVQASYNQSRSPSIPFNPSKKSDKDTLSKPSSPWSATVSMIVSLMIVIGLFLVVARLFRNFAPGPQRMLPKEVVQVLGRTPLAPRQSMVLVRFGRKLILVNQQLGQATPLGEIDNPTEVDHLLGLCEEQSSTSISNSFREVLMQLTDKTMKPASRRRDQRAKPTNDPSFETLG